MPDHLTIGLRFDQRDIPHFIALAEECVRRGVGDAGLWFKAAESARDDEPLVIRCTEVDQAHRYAAEFVTRGCRMPAVEPLTGYTR